MIKQHYEVLTYENLLDIHNQVFPEKTKKILKKLKVITKK